MTNARAQDEAGPQAGEHLTTSNPDSRDSRVGAPRRAALVRRLVAEFVVIVLGVLVALAADRWITRLDRDALEEDYLSRLEADLKRDSALAVFVLSTSRSAADLSERLLLWVDGVPVPASLDEEAAMRELLSAWYLRFDFDLKTWEELLATGNLGVVESTRVQEALGEYQSVVRTVRHWEDTWNEDGLRLDRALQRLVPPLVKLQALRDLEPPGFGHWPRPLMGQNDLPTVDRDDLLAFIDAIRRDREAHALIGQMHLVHSARILNYQSYLLPSIDSTLAVVRAPASN